MEKALLERERERGKRKTERAACKGGGSGLCQSRVGSGGVCVFTVRVHSAGRLRAGNKWKVFHCVTCSANLKLSHTRWVLVVSTAGQQSMGVVTAVYASETTSCVGIEGLRRKERMTGRKVWFSQFCMWLHVMICMGSAHSLHKLLAPLQQSCRVQHQKANDGLEGEQRKDFRARLQCTGTQSWV